MTDVWEDGGGPTDTVVERILRGQPTRNGVRAPILDSWRRCQAVGLAPDMCRPRLLDDLDYDIALVRAARPVFDRGEITIAGTPAGMFLADSAGRKYLRVVGDASMRRALDAVGAAPGFSYAEPDMGTNAVGEALAERRTCQVSGNEHFVEALRGFTAVATPIHHPLSGRVDGVVCVACPCEKVNAAMMDIAWRSARTIEQRLLELSTERERALMEAFLRERGGRIVTASPGSAPRDLSHRDRLALEEAAVRLVARGRAAVVEVALSDGRTATLVATPVNGSPEPVGIAVQAWLAEK